MNDVMLTRKQYLAVGKVVIIAITAFLLSIVIVLNS